MMLNVSYGFVRKKSNQAADDKAARKPAKRLPKEPTATTTRTSTSAEAGREKLPRNGTRAAETATGSNRPQRAATHLLSSASKRRLPDTQVTTKTLAPPPARFSQRPAALPAR